MYELVRLECEMEESGRLFMEDMSANISMVTFVERLVAYIRKCAATMVDYAKTIELDIAKNLSNIKLKLALASMRKKIEQGQTVYIPDLKSITTTYRGIVTELRREMNKITKELSKIKIVESWRIDSYITKKENFKEKLDELVHELDQALDKKIAVKNTNTNELTHYTSKVMGETRMYVAEYTKLIRDIEKISIDFERLTKHAEITYDLKKATKDHISKIEKVQGSATRLLRKSVFVVCAIIA